jgi:hypothetical protein
MLARARRVAGGPLNGADAPAATVKNAGFYLVDIQHQYFFYSRQAE